MVAQEKKPGAVGLIDGINDALRDMSLAPPNRKKRDIPSHNNKSNKSNKSDHHKSGAESANKKLKQADGQAVRVANVIDEQCEVQVTFCSARQLRHIVEAMNELVPDVEFAFQGRALTVQAMDTAHICLVALELRADDAAVFESYYTRDGGATAALHLPHLLSVLRLGAADDQVRFVKHASSQGSIRVTLTSMSADDEGENVRTVDVDLRLMHLHNEELVISGRSPAIRVTVETAELSSTLRNMAQLASDVCIELIDGRLTFVSRGETGRASVALVPLETVAVDGGGDLLLPVRTTTGNTQYSLRHLATIMRGAPLSEQVVLELVQDMPLGVEFGIHGRSGLRYYLAPKIHDDDDTDVGGSDDGEEFE